MSPDAKCSVASSPGDRPDAALSAAEEVANLGCWTTDIRSGVSQWTQELLRMYGFPLTGRTPTREDILDRVHPEDRDMISGIIDAVIQRPGELASREIPLDHRTVHPDGTIRELRSRGRMELDDGAAPARRVGAALDITEQRETERELDAYYALDQALTAWVSLPDGAPEVLAAVGGALDYPIGVFWVADQDSRWLRVRKGAIGCSAR